MFEKFPKTRPPLPEAHQKVFVEHYKNNREGNTALSSMSQKVEGWLHRKVAADLKEGENKSTLEIGAGTLNQLKHENTKPYDIIEPFKELYENAKDLDKIRTVYKDIDDVPFQNQYDRITSVATFEHVTDLPKVVAKSCLHLKDDGSLRVSIPNEGNFLWQFTWMATTGVEFAIRYGLDFRYFMRHEHINTAKEIEEVLAYFYGKLDCSCFGLGKGFALYRFYECKQPNLTRAKEYLKSIEK